jgi:hypothetical protein
MHGLLFCALLYLLPTIIAFGRHHHSANSIMLVNVLLGWTVIGWIVAFIWSLTYPRPFLVQPVAYGVPIRYCNRCGVASAVGNSYCSNCGAAL